MRMILVVIAVVTSGLGLAAQTPSGWSQVLALPAGTTVIVTTTDGAQLSRRQLLSADDRGVTVSDTAVPPARTIARQDVAEIATVAVREASFKKKYFTRGMWGGIVGSYAGAYIGASIDRARHADASDLSGMVFGTLGGGVVGAVIAMRTGKMTSEDVAVIYRRPRRP